MKSLFRLMPLFIFSVLIIEGCKKNDDSSVPNTQPTTPPATSGRDAVVQDYNANYLGSAVASIGWTGSSSSCSAGSVASSTNAAVIKRINYFRRMVGLNDNCTLDASKYAQEQETALMMTCNNQLSHYPPSSWSCYTSTGATGASSSNLALGITGSDAVTAFIEDDGTGNEPCGHRRWIFHSPKTSYSCGSTNNAMALYVFGATGNTKIPEYIAYPPNGYVPQQLVFNRWSFGKPNADFSTATVTMTGPSGTVPVSVISSTANGYGDNTIVFVPTGINTSSTADITYSVTVTGVKVGGTPQTYAYNVTLIKP